MRACQRPTEAACCRDQRFVPYAYTARFRDIHTRKTLCALRVYTQTVIGVFFVFCPGAVLELAKWACSLRGAAGALKSTFASVRDRIWEDDPATSCPASCYNLRLPGCLRPGGKLTPWRSDPGHPLPASCGHLSETAEQRILASLASDLAGYF